MQHSPIGILVGGGGAKTILMLRENREHRRPLYLSIHLVDSFEQSHLHFSCTVICTSWLWKVAHSKHDRGNSVESLAPMASCLATAPHPWWQISMTNIIGFWHFFIDRPRVCVSLILAIQRHWSVLQNLQSKTAVKGHPRCVTRYEQHTRSFVFAAGGTSGSKQMTSSVSG